MSNNRRSFIKKIGAFGAGAGILPLVSLTDKSSIDDVISDEEIGDGKATKLNILQTTDVHCQIHAHDELFWENNKAVYRKTGGYAHFSTFLKSERKKYKNTFLIDTGDMFQGSELSVKTTGHAISPILNTLDYDLYLPGNWEVVYGKKEMQSLLGGLNGPKVCANMYHDLGNGNKGELVFPPYYIWNVNGVKIGFLGYTDHLVPIRQSPNYSKGILYTKPEENIAHYSDVLKNQEGCAFIIVVAHIGLSQQIHLANQPFCEHIDYIFGGDTHERVRVPIECKYAKVVEPGAFGSFCGKLELTVQEGKVTAEKYSLVEIASKTYKADEEMVSLIKNIEKPYIDNINEIVGYSTIPLYRYFVIENTIDTMIINALRWKLPEIDIVLSNGFRFCPPRTTPDQTGNIPITNGFIFDMLPVDSMIRKGKVSGQQLVNWMEKELNNVFAKDASKRFGGWVTKFNGMEIKFNAFGEEGQRIKSILIGGKDIDLDKIYSICACEREGDPDDMLCRMKNVKETTNTAFTLHGTLKDYLKNNSPVTPTPKKSAIALDAPETLLTQVTGVKYQFS
jgi:2',3'-cyclic-nucleotide 2'-phosphodiesterase (5'-nucleotidase family)